MCKLILLYEKNIVTAIWSACFCVNVGSCYHCQQLSFTEIVLLKYLLVVRRQNVQNDNHLLSRKSGFFTTRADYAGDAFDAVKHACGLDRPLPD